MSSMQTYVTQVSDLPRASTASVDVLGQIRFIGNKVYKYVKYIDLADQDDTSVDAAVGDQLLYSDYSAHTVTIDGTDVEAGSAGGNGAGIATVVVDGVDNAGHYFWMQIQGPATLSTAIAGSPVLGGGITGSTTDKTFTKAVTLVPQRGTYLNATGPEVILNCPV